MKYKKKLVLTLDKKNLENSITEKIKNGFISLYSWKTRRKSFLINEILVFELFGVLCIERSSDDQSSDLASSSPNFIQFGISQDTPGRVVVDVAITAKDLE